MDIAIAGKGTEFTLQVRVVKAETSDHSYYGTHARYRLQVLEGIVDDEGNVIVAEGLDWIEVRQPADGTTLLMNDERKQAFLAKQAEDDDASITEADVDGLTKQALVDLAADHDVDLPAKATKAEIKEILLNA